MEHSAKFEKVKVYYDKGLWTKKMVSDAVVKGWITKVEYEEIVNEQLHDDYDEDSIGGLIEEE